MESSPPTKKAATHDAPMVTPEAPSAREAWRDALHGLPYKDKAAYMEAVFSSPHLIETESKPDWFLRMERWDVQRAATRLATYWRERQDAFGDRYLLPLDLSEGGAFTAEEVSVLKTGLTILPDDSFGRCVTMLDFQRLKASMKPAVSSRFFFFWAAKIARNPLSQTDGIVMISLITDPKFSVEYSQDIVDRCMPFRVQVCHVCSLSRAQEFDDFATSITPAISKTLKHCYPGRVLLHSCRTEAELKQWLRGFGLTEDGLPSSLGGSWTYKSYSWEPSSSSRTPLSIKTESHRRDQLDQKRQKRFHERLEWRHWNATGRPKAVLSALLTVKRESQCSLRDLLRSPCVRSQAVTTLRAGVGSGKKCGQLDERVSLTAKVPNPIGASKKQPPSERTIYEELRRTHAKTQLLRSLRRRIAQKQSAHTKDVGVPSPLASIRNSLHEKLLEHLRAKVS